MIDSSNMYGGPQTIVSPANNYNNKQLERFRSK